MKLLTLVREWFKKSNKMESWSAKIDKFESALSSLYTLISPKSPKY